MVWLVLLALIVAVLPARGASAAPNAQYFAPTGHWVQGDFLTFFEQNGGLDNFGFPRTEQLTVNGRLVQYFQRGRMESWPENPAPYNVQLMLIGDAVMGPGDPPIPTARIPSAGDTASTYFPQTGHTLSGAFRDYFDSHGGLTIFGYPTSEQYTGPSGFVIQRFQRARFELHPELPAGSQVSLGLLGDEYIFSMGMVSFGLTEPVSAVAPTATTQSLATTDGRFLYQTKPGGDIVVSGVDGSGAHVVGQGIDPSWSPDGKQIAYAVWGINPGIYVANANGSERHVIYVASDTRSPVWSPDGSQIAFYHRYNGWKYLNGGLVLDDFFQVIVVRLKDGSYWIPSNQPNHSYSPSWSPDGSTLVFSGDNGLELVTATTPAQIIPNTSFQFTTPTWAPDGTQIAFTLRNHDHWDVGVINPDGSNMQVLTAGDGVGGTPANNAAATWSPSGNRLAFISDRSGNWNLYIMNRDGTNVIQTSVNQVTYTGSYDRVVAWRN
jgi:hypothetical protein